MSSARIFAFQIFGGASSTTNLAVTAASQQLTLPPVSSDGNNIILTVIGSQTVFIAYGNVTASVTTSMPLLAGSQTTLSFPGGVSQISAIAGSTGSTLYVTVGEGL